MIRDIKCRLDAPQGEEAFLDRRDDLDLESHFLLDTLQEDFGVARFADRAGGNRFQTADLQTGHHLFEIPERLQRLLHRFAIEFAGRAQRPREARALPLFVDDPKLVAVDRFGHDQTHTIGANVNGRQTASRGVLTPTGAAV